MLSGPVTPAPLLPPKAACMPHLPAWPPPPRCQRLQPTRPRAPLPFCHVLAPSTFFLLQDLSVLPPRTFIPLKTHALTSPHPHRMLRPLLAPRQGHCLGDNPLGGVPHPAEPPDAGGEWLSPMPPVASGALHHHARTEAVRSDSQPHLHTATQVQVFPPLKTCLTF